MKGLGALMGNVFAIIFATEQAFAADCPASAISLGGGTYQLTADYVRTGSGLDCLTFTGGGTVDLNGHTITATDGQDAITCSSGSTTIIDTGATKGGITGTWSGAAIFQCANVNGVRITGFGARYGIYSNGGASATGALNQVQNNLVEAWDFGILGGLVLSRQSFVRKNVVTTGNIGIELDLLSNDTGSGLASVDGNTIYGSESYGILLLTSFASATNNLLTSRMLAGITSVAIQSNANNSVGNYCDSCGSEPNCDNSECEFDSSTANRWDFPISVNGACPGTITSNLTLSADADLGATSGSCITVNGPYVEVDLAGHVLTNSAVGGTAITCTTSGTTVKITDSTGLGGIRGGVGGSFSTGISGCRTIENLRVQDTNIGVLNSSTTYGLDSLTSTFINGETTAVDTYAAARTSNIIGNKFRSAHTGLFIRGVGASGTGKVTVSDNVIRESHDVALKVTGSTNVLLSGNLMYRRDASLAPSGTCVDASGVTTNHLLCSCADDCPDTVDPPIVYPF
jgi:hypothetical protein